MESQTLLWQAHQQSSDFSELCNALYERELSNYAKGEHSSLAQLQGRIKSLPHYVKRTADAMLRAQSPLILDVQNASWSAKQARQIPSLRQIVAADEIVTPWYKSVKLSHGLVVPIALETHIVLDSIDRIDNDNKRFRTNIHGWFNLNEPLVTAKNIALLKPTKPVMTAACSGHYWLNQKKSQPRIPSLRELLLSCAINWRNFKQPLTKLSFD
jgi:hypothetical protein